ncbi:S-adenosylmethionine transporter [Multifurca ochricompacta]|uniref:S-adenosylmethionine transporter n=1 Tax=Multifurca ochricompacta TaxID=376703 RepID=A0AAD4MD79_9AGAM|nr:S-adenosylmethionine transporter [Multifurca ochricompacta]
MSSVNAPTFGQSLIAGGLAGTSVDLLFYPIDSIKTRLQSNHGFYKAGGFRGIYNGVGSVIVGSAPGAAIFFCTYDTLKHVLPIPSYLGPINHMVSASIGEIAACLIRVPTEVIKTRSQTSSYGALANSSLATARLVWKTNGLKGFYRGFNTLYFVAIPMYEIFKQRLSYLLYHKPSSLRPYEASICGSAAGGIAAALTTPLDVLKTRIMLDLRKIHLHLCQDPSHPSYLPPVRRLGEIYASEGLRALFAGVIPRTMWISAGGAVFLGMYEWTIDSFNSSQEGP